MAKGSVEASTNGALGKSKSDVYVFEEIIPGLSVKSAPRPKKAAKEPIPPPAPSTPSPPEANYSTFKTVNSVTQLMYTRYRNAKKRLARIEALEAKAENSEPLGEVELQLLSRKSDDLATVNEIHKILPQIAEMSQEAITRAEEEKALAEKKHQEEIESAVRQERERGQKNILKAVELFSSILLASQEQTLTVDPQAQAALESLARSFTTKPLNESKKAELVEHLNLFSEASENLLSSDSITYKDLSAAVDSMLTHDPTPEVSTQGDSAGLPDAQEAVASAPVTEDNFFGITFTDQISEDDPDSLKIELTHFTVVPPGGISFLSPSEIFPRGQPQPPLVSQEQI